MRTYEEAVKQYKEECEEIAIQCEEEGYPSNGSNYDLRVAALEPYYPEIFGKEE